MKPRNGIGSIAGLVAVCSLVLTVGMSWWVNRDTQHGLPTPKVLISERSNPTTGEPRLAHGPLVQASGEQVPLDEGAAESLRALDLDPPAPGQHPLVPLVRWADTHLDRIRAIPDYECIFHKRERIDGVLQDRQVMEMKVRHQPFSVYVKFLAPASMRGQEVIYVDGQNDGKLQVHLTGLKEVIGTRSLDPHGYLATDGNRYPITDSGVLRLVERLIEVGKADALHPECEVRYREVRMDKADCTLIEVVHPVKAPHYRYHIARVYVNQELQLPVRYEAYSWPTTSDGEPELSEEYTYQKIQVGGGLSEDDFSVSNAAYNF